MKISLGSWAFSFGPYASNPVAFDKTAERLAAAGFDGIEVCGFPPHVTLISYPTLESRRALVEFLRDLNLEVSGYAADFTMANPVAAGNEHKYLEVFKQNLDMAIALNSPSIRVDTVAAPGSLLDSEYEGAMDRIGGVWHQAAALAVDAGVRMVWEFEPGYLFNKPSEVVRLHEKVGHPNFHVLFDTSHAYLCGVVGARQHGPPERLQGGVKEFLNLLAGRIGAIHLIDSDGSLHADETSTHCPFGEGNIDFKSLAPELKKVPGIDWWCIDLSFCPGSWDLVEPSLQYVRKFLK